MDIYGDMIYAYSINFCNYIVLIFLVVYRWTSIGITQSVGCGILRSQLQKKMPVLRHADQTEKEI